MSDFKGGFVKDFKEKEAFEAKQEKLKKKHKIDDESVVVVDKINAMKYLIMLFKTVLSICVFALAVIGLITIIYAEPREEVITIIKGAFSGLL